MKPGEEKIFSALIKNPDGLTYSKLKDLTKLSGPSLSKYLNGFVDLGVLKHEPETRKYSVPLGHVPLRRDFLENKEMDIEDMIRMLIRVNYLKGFELKNYIENEEEIKKILKEWIPGVFEIQRWLNLLLLESILRSTFDVNKRNIDGKKFIKDMRNRNKDWLSPFYDTLIYMLYEHRDIIIKNEELINKMIYEENYILSNLPSFNDLIKNRFIIK